MCHDSLVYFVCYEINGFRFRIEFCGKLIKRAKPLEKKKLHMCVNKKSRKYPERT